MPQIKWGTHTRTVLDVGCGVASFGGYLLDRNVITMSFAPKDEHEAQIQFALERGIPALLAVIGTQKLPFPDNAFDVIHCARCRVHWYADGKYFEPFLLLYIIIVLPLLIFNYGSLLFGEPESAPRIIGTHVVVLCNSVRGYRNILEYVQNCRCKYCAYLQS
jgi:SAM-dependent methyltransferase